MVHSCQLRVYKIVTIAVAHFKIMLSLSVVIVLIFLFLVMLYFSKRAQYLLTIFISSYYVLQLYAEFANYYGL